MMKSPIRTAILGAGASTRVFHAPLIAAAGALFDLAAIGARDPSRAAPVAGVPILPIDAVLADASIALVVVATPPDSHADLATRALAAGKHVVLEKPAAASVAQVDAIAAAAARADRKVAVFHNRRWDSDFLTLRALVEQGALGRVVHVESAFDRFRPAVRARWRESAAPGGGLWFDLGPHLIDQALQLFGWPEAITLDQAVLREGGLADDWFQARLHYPALRVVLRASMLAATPSPRFVVHGSAGSWTKRGLDPQEDALKAGERPAWPPRPGWGVDAGRSEVTLAQGEALVSQPWPLQTGRQGAYYAAVHDALRGQAANPVPPEQAVAVMALIECGQRSAREGRTLPAGESPLVA